MALQARFIADFASFFTAVEQAEVKLKSFDSGANRVSTSLNRMTDSFSGRRIIQEATLMAEAIERGGGTATLTARELERAGNIAAEAAEKMKKLGIDVPAGIQNVADAAKGTQPPLTAMSVAFGTLAAQAAMKAAGALTDFGKEAVAASTRAETLASVAKFMGLQAGYTTTEIDALANSLKTQGITTAQSYDTIIQMTRANLSLADATKLATTAQSLARATGQNSSEVLGQLIRGTQTLQVETLRNAGVVVQLDQEYIKYAATQGRVVTSLGAQEKQQIALAAVLREGEKVAGVYGVTNQNVGGKIQSMTRLQEEAAKAIGDQYLPAVRFATEAEAQFYKMVAQAPALFAALGTAVVGGVGYVTAFKGAAMLGAISTGTLTTALGLLGPAAAVAATAFASWNLGKWVGEITGLTDGVERLAGRMMGLSEADISAGMAARKYAESSEGKAAAVRAQAESLTRLETKAREMAIAAAKQAEEDAKALEAAKEAQREAVKYAAAMEELKSSGDGWKGTLAGINAEVVKAVKGYLEAGVSQTALATVYKLTATQVRAVASALADEEKAHKATEAAADKAARVKEQALLQTTKLWNEYNTLIVERTGTATDVQIAKIREWAADVTAQAVRAGTDTKEFYEALAAVSKEKTAQVMVDWDMLRANSRASLDETAAKAWATFDAIQARSGSFSTEFIQQKRAEAEAAQLAADTWGMSFSANADKVQKKSDETASRLIAGAQAALSWGDAMMLVWQGKGTMTMTVPHVQPDQTPWGNSGRTGWGANVPSFATGVENFSGGLARVHKDELLVNLPKGTDVIPPSRARGGASIVNNYSINVSTVAGNPDEIARVVKAALVGSERAMGRRLSLGG